MDSPALPANSGPQRSRNDKGRRGWSTKEEEVLAEGMKKIIQEGWKSENGFKTGYLNALETFMKKKLPNCTLKQDPHITSRLTVWKRNYNTLFDILKNTGVGMDPSTHMIEATDEQWEAFIKADPNAQRIKPKSWPLYLAWCEIFGSTRATGVGAQDHKAAEKPPTEVEGDNGSIPINLDDGDEVQSQNSTKHMGESSAAGKSSGRRKRKSASQVHDPFIDVMHEFCDSASARLGEIAQRIGYEQDLSIARKKIHECVKEMDCMTRSEKLRVTALIANNSANLDVFFSLPVEDRLEWTLMVLRGEI